MSGREKFYAPLKQVAKQYIPLLMARMQVLQSRANQCLDYLEMNSEAGEEEEEESETLEQVVLAQTTLHKSVLEAALCQSLVGSFADLLEGDYQRIKNSEGYFLNEEGDFESLYEEGNDGGLDP
jgi:hypothetical protein